MRHQDVAVARGHEFWIRPSRSGGSNWQSHSLNISTQPGAFAVQQSNDDPSVTEGGPRGLCYGGSLSPD
jgi:hypothetical protein